MVATGVRLASNAALKKVGFSETEAKVISWCLWGATVVATLDGFSLVAEGAGTLCSEAVAGCASDCVASQAAEHGLAHTVHAVSDRLLDASSHAALTAQAAMDGRPAGVIGYGIQTIHDLAGK